MVFLLQLLLRPLTPNTEISAGLHAEHHLLRFENLGDLKGKVLLWDPPSPLSLEFRTFSHVSASVFTL